MRSVARLAAAAAATAVIAGAVHLRAVQREAAAEAAYPPQGQFLTIDGIRVHAVVAGSGPDLVLIHGAGGSVRDFTFSLLPRLAARYRVIAIDRPGHGYTDDLGGDASPRRQARILARAADLLGADRPLVVGHSFGGAVAMAWALEAPRETAGLVILSGATMPWPGEVDLTYRITASLPGRTLLAPAATAFVPIVYARDVLAAVFAPQSVPAGYADHFGLAMAIRRKVLRANAVQVAGLRPHVVEMSEQYPGLDLPIEIVHGDADPVLPIDVHARPLSRRLPNANLTVLEGIGHMPHHVRESDVVAVIDRAASRTGLR